MFTLFYYGFFISVFAVSYRLVLSKEPILNWWFMFGLRFSSKWFYKPIWGCEKCFAGQVALWVYLLNWLSVNFDRNAPFWYFLFKVIPKCQPNNFNALNGLIFVFGTIITTNVLSKLYEKYIINA